MASAWSEAETFVCSVCLETLNNPATLPCGHSYCLDCIKKHWDQGDKKGQYTCPQCRQVFNPRPSLAKSTVLVEAMEKLRENSFRQSPSLSIPTAPPSMPIYLEVLPDVQPLGPPQRQGSVYPKLPTVAPRLCPKHQKPMDLFCHDDKDCVCQECCQQAHMGHRVLTPEEGRKECQKEIIQMQADVHRRIKDAQRKIQELPLITQQHKASIQALRQESVALSSELVRCVDDMGVQVGELLCAHEASLGSQVEGHIHSLQQEVSQLCWKTEEMGRLAEMQDHICFLKSFLTLEPLRQSRASDNSRLGQEEALLAGIRSAMAELSVSLQDLCKSNLAKIFKIVNDVSMAQLANGVARAGVATTDDTSVTLVQENHPGNNAVYEMTTNPPPLPPPQPQGTRESCTPPPLPPRCLQAPAFPPSLPPPHAQASPATTMVNKEPQTREELLKFRFEPTMDPNTVFRHILLSDGGHKATLRAENLNLTDHPERFQFWRQVMCKESLAGSPYYWEVEWTGHKITIGVAYKEIERKSSDVQSRLGHNAHSWSLNWSGTGFSFWYGGQETLLGSPKARRVGVYLDQHAGVLAFYRISNNQAHLIHRHQTQFSGPVYPGFRFWSGVGVTVTVCQLN